MSMKAEQQYIDLFTQCEAMICRQSADVLNAPRAKAFADFEKLGFPTRKQEKYKYTEVSKYFAPDYGLNLNRLEFPVNPYEVFKCDVPNMSTSLYFVVNDTFDKHVHPSAQLPGDFCYNLCRTQDGKILITGDKGVTCFVPSEGTFTTIDLMRNFPSTHIINGCGILVSGEGSIYIGDTKGVTVFSENEFNKTGTANENSNFYFSELWVDNKTIIPGDDTGILSQSLPYTRELKLNYDQNNLIIHFALSDYGQQLSEKWFQYKLEGLDKNWIKTKQTELYYTNLDPGKYTLHVASINEK